MVLDIQSLLFTFFGGLGIFLFGIKFMGDGLQKIAGDGLRNLLDKFTTNPFLGVLTGMVVTILIQSSSSTTVLTVGLVSAGFMTLRQAIGVIMGANIGTTVTAFIIGIDLEAYALPILFIGTVLIFFFKNKKTNNIGQTFFGFGALFYGLTLMGEGVAPLENLPAFNDLTISMSTNPLLGVLVGVLFTVGLQSSSATIGLLQELFSQGAIPLDAALPILFGDNIGTTITAVIAAIGASVAAKRAAMIHVIFNVLGAVIVLILLVPYTAFISYLQDTLQLNPPMTIAFAHGIFNVTNMLIQLPFIGVLAYIVTRMIPSSEEEIDYQAKHLDPLFIQQSPSIALDQAKLETLRMAAYAEKGLKQSETYLETKNKKNAENITRYEEAVNNLDKNITNYLTGISSRSLSSESSRQHSVLMDTTRDIERVSDHVENLMELVDYQVSNKVTLSPEAYKDLNQMYELTMSTFSRSIEALEQDNHEIAGQVLTQEEEIDRLERQLRKKHILRLNEGQCSGSAGIVFVDMLSNLERIGDHAVNIAETVLDDDHKIKQSN
ncbi:Na/Pi cotransporter family protein [uncultured Marinococcus sp.]|uniref:Na/Pi cotransporter family protein n=1 Tax=uncultured Marinococcus sp. TaxID=487012 RepID=UPI00262CA18E|nr:Na/Pi cotransporter family protein [uncultured Marinococcus sp.]